VVPASSVETTIAITTTTSFLKVDQLV